MTKKKKILLAVLAVAVIAGTLVLGLYLGGAFRPKEGTAIDGNATKIAEEQDYSDIEENPSIAVPGYDTLYFKAGEEKQEVSFYNPAENTCYFKLSLILEDGTVLWESDLLEPDMAFNEITLNQPLEKGTYTMKLKYDCYSLKDQGQLNGAEVNVTIEVR